eukprot:74392_1
MSTLHALQSLLNHLTETTKCIKNESKLLEFIIRNKRNYHRGRIRFRHLKEVSRKHKQIIKKWNTFSCSICNNIRKNNMNAKVSSIILSIDNIGKDTKLFIDIIMKCVGSFICEYVLSGHDVNFCYLTIAILSRLYSLYCSKLSQMAQTRKILFIFYKNINPINYQTIYWNDFNLFIWPNKVINCNITNSININNINKMKWNQFDQNTLASINTKK